MSAHLENELAIARSAAVEAGVFISSHWGGDFEVRHKGEIDLVSEVDLGAEAIVTRIISAAFPDDAIVAEEGGGSNRESGRTWHIDPLDGTTNFSHGFPHFAVSIGLVIDGVPSVGVIHDPIRQWTFHGRMGGGAWLDEKALQVSETTTLGEALVSTGFPYDRWKNPDNNGHRCTHLLRRTQGMRRPGAAALDLAYIAAGWIDGYWEIKLNSWDVAAGALLVSEAGGKFSDLRGNPISVHGGSFVASNGRIHTPLVDALMESDREFESKVLK